MLPSEYRATSPLGSNVFTGKAETGLLGSKVGSVEVETTSEAVPRFRPKLSWIASQAVRTVVLINKAPTAIKDLILVMGTPLKKPAEHA